MNLKISDCGLFSPVAGDNSSSSVKNSESKQAATKITEYFQDLKTSETSKDEKETRIVKDNGQLNDLMNKKNALTKKLNSPEVRNKRTWTTDGNGNYNDCPEAIEMGKLGKQLSEYINKSLGAPQREGQEAMFESGGNTYYSKVCKGKTLFWMTFSSPVASRT